MWPLTYRNCWVMVDTAFLCLVLLSMLLLYQTGSTIIWTLMPGGGFLRVINGTFNTAQHKNDPPAQQKPVGGVFGADQPGQIAPLVGVIPDGGVQHAAADCADGQLQPADARRPDSRRRAQRQRTIRERLLKAETDPAGQKHRPVRGAAPGQFQRGIRPAAEQKQRSTFQHTKSPCTSCIATVCAGGAGCNRFVRMVGVFGKKWLPPRGKPEIFISTASSAARCGYPTVSGSGQRSSGGGSRSA